MRCHEVQPLLGDFIEHQLPPETARQVREHLTHCPACQRKCRTLRYVIGALEAFPIVAEPADLTARVMSQIAPRPVLPRFRVRWMDVIASAAGAGLFMGVLLVPEGLCSPDVWTELGQVLARAQLYLRFWAVQLHDRWMLVAGGLWTVVESGWWLLLFVVAAAALALMAVRERGASLPI